MKSPKTVLLPKVTKLLAGLGENIKLARLRKKLLQSKLTNVQTFPIRHFTKGKGLPSISMGSYAQVLFVL